METLKPAIEVLIGAGDGVRTHDIKLGKLVLYQLSYARVPGGILSRLDSHRKFWVLGSGF